MSEHTQLIFLVVACAFGFGAGTWEWVRGLIQRHEQRRADERLDAWERMRR